MNVIKCGASLQTVSTVSISMATIISRSRHNYLVNEKKIYERRNGMEEKHAQTIFRDWCFIVLYRWPLTVISFSFSGNHASFVASISTRRHARFTRTSAAIFCLLYFTGSFHAQHLNPSITLMLRPISTKCSTAKSVVEDFLPGSFCVLLKSHAPKFVRKTWNLNFTIYLLCIISLSTWFSVRVLIIMIKYSHSRSMPLNALVKQLAIEFGR